MEAERFPITVPVAAAWIYCFLTLSFIDIQAIGQGLIQVQQEVSFLLFLLIGGPMLLLVTSLAFTKSTKMLRPESFFTRWNPTQAMLVVGGIAATSVWQLFVNQFSVSPFSAQLGPQSAFAFKIDSAIAEESAFGAIAVAIYTLLRIRGKFRRYISIGLSSLPTAIFFVYYHNTNLALANVPPGSTFQQLLLFVFGLRLIIAPIQLYTHSLFSGMGIHVPWNAVS
jgi:hypothetical protein